MEIAIRSELDSRVLVYPLIKCLSLYGSVVVFTSNKSFTRLIESDLEGGFKNIRILVSLDADLDATKEAEGYFKGKYDYAIFDNVGAIDYDILMVPISNRISENFIGDLLYLVADDKTNILKFGSPAPLPKGVKPVKESKNKKEDSGSAEDTEFNKWNIEKTDEQLLQELLQDKTAKWCKFPSFDDIENMESRRCLICPDDTLIRELYKLLGTYLSVDERQFTKGAKLKDESGSDLSGTDIR